MVHSMVRRCVFQPQTLYFGYRGPCGAPAGESIHLEQSSNLRIFIIIFFYSGLLQQLYGAYHGLCPSLSLSNPNGYHCPVTSTSSQNIQISFLQHHIPTALPV